MNSFNADTFFAVGFAFWFVACLLSTIVGISYRIKYGHFKSLFKEVTGRYLKLVKLAGISFLVGTAIIVVGLILRS